MNFTPLLIKAAYPASSGVVLTVSAEYVMNLINEAQCEILVFFIIRLTIKLQEVAHGKSVGP